MAITIRKLDPRDAEQYRVCRLDMLRDSPIAFSPSYEEVELQTVETLRETFMTQRTASPNAIFGAFEDIRLIGTTVIYQEEHLKRRHKMSIGAVFVRPEYRRGKVGSMLIEAAITHARTVEGIERIELTVASSNIPAKVLYASFGFETWGTEPDFLKLDGAHYDENYMTLKL